MKCDANQNSIETDHHCFNDLFHTHLIVVYLFFLNTGYRMSIEIRFRVKYVCNKNPLTVQEWPPFIETTPNCMACGMARQNAKIHTPITNLTARDNFDMVCCLKFERKTCRYENTVNACKSMTAPYQFALVSLLSFSLYLSPLYLAMSICPSSIKFIPLFSIDSC